VFATWSKPEGPDPLSILAHQLRRRFPSNSSLVRGARPTYLTARPEGSLVFRSVRPAPNSGPKTLTCGENRPMFRGPSWDDLYRVPLRSPPASPPRRLAVGSRVARQEDHLFRRLFPAGPDKNPKALTNCLPAEIGPLVTCRTVLPLPAFWRGRDRRPDHPCTMLPRIESRKRKMR